MEAEGPGGCDGDDGGATVPSILINGGMMPPFEDSTAPPAWPVPEPVESFSDRWEVGAGLFPFFGIFLAVFLFFFGFRKPKKLGRLFR